MENNKRLKVGIFVDSFYPMLDGVVNVVNNHATLMNEYADVTVFAPKGRGSYNDKTLPYKVVRCKKKFKLSFLDYDLPLPKFDSEFLKKAEESDFDIIHIHSPFSIGKLGLEIAKKKKIPIVATLHSQFKQDFYRATKSDFLTAIMLQNIISIFNKCNECYAVNKQVGKVFKFEYKLKKNPKIQNNGTDFLYYENDDEVLKLRKEYNIKDDEKCLLFVGRINKLKNIYFTLNVLKKLKEKNFKFKMIFVGTGPDFKNFEEKIKKLELEEQVILTGKIADRELLVKHFRLGELFVFPSLYDCSSLVQIEAASQKTPTIFIRGAVTSGTCTEGVDAYFEEEDEDKFSDKIIDIFNNPEEYEKIKKGAFENLYITWNNAVKKVYEDYLKVIENFNNGKYSKKKKIENHNRKKEMIEIIKDKRKEEDKIVQAKKKIVKKRAISIKKATKNSFKTKKNKKD